MKPFCDGLEFCLGRIPKDIASGQLKTTLGYLNNNVPELIFKHAVFSTRGNETFMWVTLSPEATILTPRTMAQFMSALKALKEHA